MKSSYVTVSCIIKTGNKATGQNLLFTPDNFLINLTFTLPKPTSRTIAIGYTTVSQTFLFADFWLAKNSDGYSHPFSCEYCDWMTGTQN
jgi:hypothetical protein